MNSALQYQVAKVLDEYRGQLEKAVRIITASTPVYQYVSHQTQVPWFVVAAIHYRESSLNFTRHLHNGDPLTSRTTHVPVGRPLASPLRGRMPYRWHESAIDCLSQRVQPTKWGVVATLDYLEAYNGLGYRHRGIPTPYLWSFTDQYTRGLFIADGVFSPESFCKQGGCVAILKLLEENGLIHLLS